MQRLEDRGFSLEVKVAIAAAAIFIVAAAIATFLYTQGGLSGACSAKSLGALYICVGLASSGFITLGILGVKAAIRQLSSRNPILPPPIDRFEPPISSPLDLNHEELANVDRSGAPIPEQALPIGRPPSPVAVPLDQQSDEEDEELANVDRSRAPIPEPALPVGRPPSPVAVPLDQQSDEEDEELANVDRNRAPAPPSPVPLGDNLPQGRLDGRTVSRVQSDSRTSSPEAARAASALSETSFHSTDSSFFYEDAPSPQHTALEDLDRLITLFPELSSELNALKKLKEVTTNFLLKVFGPDNEEDGRVFCNHLASLTTELCNDDSPHAQYQLLCTFIDTCGRFRTPNYYPIASLLDAYHGNKPDLREELALLERPKEQNSDAFIALFPPESRQFARHLSERIPSLVDAFTTPSHPDRKANLHIQYLKDEVYADELKMFAKECQRCTLLGQFGNFAQKLPSLLSAFLPIILDILEHPARLRNHMESIDGLLQVVSFEHYQPDNLLSQVVLIQSSINATRAKSSPPIGIQVRRRGDDVSAFKELKQEAKQYKALQDPSPIQQRVIEQLIKNDGTIVEYFCNQDPYDTNWDEGTGAANDIRELNIAPISIVALRKGDPNNHFLLSALEDRLTPPTPEEKKKLDPLRRHPEVEAVFLVFNEMPDPKMAKYADSTLIRLLMSFGSLCTASFISGRLAPHISPFISNMVTDYQGTAELADRLMSLLLALNNNPLHNSFIDGYRRALPRLLIDLGARPNLEGTIDAASRFIEAITQHLSP